MEQVDGELITKLPKVRRIQFNAKEQQAEENGENFKAQIRKIILTVSFVVGVFYEREGGKSAGIKAQILMM